MKELFDGLYTKFFLRDILAKAIPGFIVLAGITDCLWARPFDSFHRGNIIIFTLIYGVSFATGMLMQFAGSSFRLIKIHVWPDTKFFSKPNHKESLEKLSTFLKNTDKKPDIRMERERLVILKQMSGTYAIAALLFAVSYTFRFCFHYDDPSDLIIAIVLWIVFVILVLDNHFRAFEQNAWESLYQ